MRHLADAHAVAHECFASPLNATLASFCSAFPDTDAPFGSIGSFFDSDFARGGSYQVGPPYNEAVLQRTSSHLLRSLEAADAAGALPPAFAWAKPHHAKRLAGLLLGSTGRRLQGRRCCSSVCCRPGTTTPPSQHSRRAHTSCTRRRSPRRRTRTWRACSTCARRSTCASRTRVTRCCSGSPRPTCRRSADQQRRPWRDRWRRGGAVDSRAARLTSSFMCARQNRFYATGSGTLSLTSRAADLCRPTSAEQCAMHPPCCRVTSGFGPFHSMRS